MSDWITHRRPTEEDAYYGDVHSDGYVYVTNERGMTRTATWKAAAYHGFPWQPIVIPEPYMKPKRYQAKYNSFYGYWVVFETETLANTGKLYQLTENNDEHCRAAERIAEAYEEVMP